MRKHASSGARDLGQARAGQRGHSALQTLTLPAAATQKSAACAPRPIKLPVPGKQPADPAAAEQQVRAAFQNAVTHAPPGGDIYHAMATVQNGDRLHRAIDQVRSNYPQAFDTITVKTGDLVFTNPTTAVVQFTPTYTGGAPYGTQNGTAVLKDGKWLVTDATYCCVLQYGGATCP